MAQADPFADLIPSATPAGNPTAPGVIYGRPKQPAPVSAADKTLKDIQIDKGLADLADRNRPTLSAGYRWKDGIVGGEQEPIPGGPAAMALQNTQNERDKVGSEQAKASNFALRGRNALSVYDQYVTSGVGPEGMLGRAGNASAPTLASQFTSDRRNAVRGVERDFIAAVLRYDSGAAIPPAEFDNAYQQYFPNPNAGPEEIASKKAARETALQGLMIGAGPGADKLPPLPPPMSLGGTTQDAPFTKEQSLAFWGANYTDQDGNPLGPEGGIAIRPDGSRTLVTRITDTREADARDADIQNEIERRAGLPGARTPGITDLATQGASFGLSDEIMGAAEAIARGLTGDGKGYAFERDLYRRQLDQARDRLGGFGTAAEIGGAFLTGNPNALAGAGTQTLGQLARQGALTGAGTGAAAGFGYGRGAEESAKNALLGAAVGAPLGAGLGAVGARLNSRSSTTAPNSALQAADDLGVTMLPADVGGVGTRMASGGISRTLGGIPLAEGAQRSVASAAAAKNRIADAIGDVADQAGAGQAVRRGVKSFAKGSAARAEQLYEAVPIAPKIKVQLDRTREALGEVTQGFQSNPELSRLWVNHPRLRSSLEALTPKDTREAGRVRLLMETERVNGAREGVNAAQESATAALQGERLAAQRELDAANAGYEKLLAEARQDLATAKVRSEAMRAQAPSEAGQSAGLQKEIDAAQARYNAIRSKDLSNSEAASVVRPISEAEKKVSALKDAKASTPELEDAQAALTKAIDAKDKAYVEANQPPVGGELSWQDMKRFRTIVGEIIGQPGIASDGSDIAALRKLYGALTTDMEATAAQQGPRALTEFRRASQYWRGREARLEDVFSNLLGPNGQRSDERIFTQLNAWASGKGGDFSRIARTIRSLPADEANTVRATLVQRMGLSSPARQDATNQVFSPAEFSSQWRGLSERAKNVLFPNKQHRDDLEKLALVTDQMKRASQYENFSNTSLGVNVTAQGALALTNLPVATALAGLQFGAGKLLASPRVARALASATKLPAERAEKVLSTQLAAAAAKEPAIAGDIKSLQDFLAQSFNQSPGRLAASEDEGNGRPKPPQQ